VFHAHAKTQGPHAGGIGHGVVELAEDQVHAAMVAGVDGAELGGHVAAAAPLQSGEIGGIGHGEVVEGGQQALIEGAPEAEFGGNAGWDYWWQLLNTGTQPNRQNMAMSRARSISTEARPP